MTFTPIRTASGLLDRVRQPEYTGQNRCIPCTIANAVIAAVLAAAAGLVSVPLGVAVFAVSVAAIALRGYLVPGTPTLTKRYFPDWLLAVFDKDPRASAADIDIEDFEPEAYLAEAGIVEDDPDIDDLVLEDEFEAAWVERMDGMAVDDEATGAEELGELIGVDPERIAVEPQGKGAVVAFVDDNYVGKWESRAAYVADMAAARELDERSPEWRDLPLPARSSLLGALRIFVERCPTCHGEVVLGDEVVESCCRSYSVVTARCTGCNARLLELQVDPETVAAADPETDAPTADS